MHHTRALLVAALAICAGGAALADNAIFTGGQTGAYHSLFCPPLTPALANAYFPGYNCTPSAGTVDNITKVLANPKQIGFVQLDVMAQQGLTKPDDIKKLIVIRPLACEGLWMVTKNPRINGFGDVIGLARRIPFILPPANSGSAATFAFLQSIDPDGLGQAQKSNITNLASTLAVLQRIAAGSSGEVGFFVQFADPTNENIKFMVDSKLKIIPVVSKQVVEAKVNDQTLYQVQSYSFTTPGIFTTGQSATTACTPAAIVTGDPTAAFTVKGDQNDQRDMIEAVRKISDADLLPKESRIAAIIKGAKRISGRALDEMVAAADLARQKISQ